MQRHTVVQILVNNYTQLYQISYAYLIARIDELSGAHQNRSAVSFKTQTLTETIQPHRQLGIKDHHGLEEKLGGVLAALDFIDPL